MFLPAGMNLESAPDATVYAAILKEVAQYKLPAGTNLENGLDAPMFASISKAVAQHKLSEDVVREAVKPLFYTRMRLGLFDPPNMNPYASLDPAIVVQSAEHRDLSLKSALQSIVLLKNDGILPLPLGKIWKKIAVSLV